MFTIYNPYVTYDVAEAICRVMGGHLAAFETQQEYEMVRPLLDTSLYYWLDGRDVSYTDTFIWVHSGMKFSSTFTNWHPDRPISVLTHKKDRCVAQYLNYWYNSNCMSTARFICEY